MLQVHNLSKRYDSVRPVDAVIDVSVDIAAGQFVVVVGRSGSGKSTLLGMIGGLCRPTAGAVTIAGRDPWTLGDDARADFRRRHIGFAFQTASLLPALRALDNVALPALLEPGSEPTLVYTRAAELLARAGLDERMSAYPAELSGGEQRRVALARALILGPPLLLADEPTGDLDEDTEAKVIAGLLEACRAYKAALLLVTHNLALAQQADRVLHMNRGRICEGPLPAQAVGKPAPVVFTEPIVPACVAARPTTMLAADVIPRPGRGLAWTVAVLLGLLALDFGVGQYQDRWKRSQRAERANLERAALFQLRSDVDRLAYGEDGRCRLSLYVTASPAAETFQVMAPTLRAYVQVGVLWQELPCRSADGQEGRVLALSGRQTFDFIFEPNVKDFEELLPGYMHVRFHHAMLVSKNRGDGQELLVERVDDTYVYLLPRRPDEEKVKRNRFPGQAPLWIPMPPH